MRTPAALIALVSALFMATAVEAGGLSEDKKDKKVYGEVRENDALIYIVRTGSFGGKPRTERVFLEDNFVGVLPNDTYTFTYAAPGLHLLWRVHYRDPLFLDVLPGHTYYVVFRFALPSVLVEEAEGKAALQKCKKYRPIGEEDRADAAGELRDKWPELKARYGAGLAAGAAQDYVPPPSTEGLVKVPQSTALVVELMENVSSGSAKVGDVVWVRVRDDVALDGALVVRRGAAAKAVIRDAADRQIVRARGGLVDIAVLSVTAADGSECPVTGHVAGRGAAGARPITYVVAAFGIAGAIASNFTNKADQALHPAGEVATVYLRQDVWIKAADPGAATESRAGEAGPTVAASLGGPIPCQLQKGEGPKSIDVVFDTPEDISSAALTHVDGVPLPTPVAAVQVLRPKAGVAASFEGWAVCRYLKPHRTPAAREGSRTGEQSGGANTQLTIRAVNNQGAVFYAQVSAAMSK